MLFTTYFGFFSLEASSLIKYSPSIPNANKFSPPLTTIHTPMIDVGTEAARILLDKINEINIPARTIKIKPELIVRSSSGPKK